jgi:two-component sensor histidine kinase
MSPADAAAPALLLAPVGRDAELGCAALGEAGIDCRAGRGLADLEQAPLEELGALVLTGEMLTARAVETLRRRLDAQPGWSNLAVILLVDAGRLPSPDGAGARFNALAARPGVIVLHRPTDRDALASVIRAALADRRRQARLRDELEARAAAEARAQTLAAEMKHRVKNAFALASGIARQTLRGATSLEDARDAFIGRLEAMARAQDLIAPDAAAIIDLREIVERTLAPHRPAEGSDRIAVEGPPVLIPAEKATALAMTFHELATNAAKYGALSTASGCVSLRWRVASAGGPDELSVEWRERGGPPVSPPERRGFGSRLVERALAHELGASVELTFDRAGVACSIRAQLVQPGA